VGRNRSGVLELAVLGLLHGNPMHGYELRKRLYTVLGAFRALSYGSLYPCLHELLAAGLIAEEHDGTEPQVPASVTVTARSEDKAITQPLDLGPVAAGALVGELIGGGQYPTTHGHVIVAYVGPLGSPHSINLSC